MNLRHVKTSENNLPCTALENIVALSYNPNSWMTKSEIESCKSFLNRVEIDAEVLLKSIEESCSSALNNWKNHQ